MKVFISWSGETSKQAAVALKNWLGGVIQAVEPWISGDIEKGARWSYEITQCLEEAAVGIIILTPDNLTAPWILFEAGALSRVDGTYVCTLLLNVAPTDVQQPLGQFQHTVMTKEDLWKLVLTINNSQGRSGTKPLDEGFLRTAFEKWWPDLEKELDVIMAGVSTQEQKPRQERELLEELLELTRSVERRVVSLESTRSRESLAVDWIRAGREGATKAGLFGLDGAVAPVGLGEPGGLAQIFLDSLEKNKLAQFPNDELSPSQVLQALARARALNRKLNSDPDSPTESA